MAKHSKKEMKGMEEADVCEDCGESQCCCEGESCCGPHGWSGHVGWHESWAKKKIMLGIGLIGLAVLWYAKNTGYLNPALFWPVVFGLAGIALFMKGLMLKKQEDRCCGRC